MNAILRYLYLNIIHVYFVVINKALQMTPFPSDLLSNYHIDSYICLTVVTYKYLFRLKHVAYASSNYCNETLDYTLTFDMLNI